MKNVPTNLIALIILALSMDAHTAVFCATDSTELQSALLTAANNNQDDHIKVATGQYQTPVGGFIYPDGNANENRDLEISGGWTTFFGNPCGQQLTTLAMETVLDGNDEYRGLNLIVGDGNSDLTVSNLLFTNGNIDAASGGGLLVSADPSYGGDITIYRNAFIGNTARNAGAFRLNYGNRITVKNNLIALNHTEQSQGAVFIYQSNSSSGIYFIHNTVVDNTSDSTFETVSAGLAIAANGISQALVVNSIFWNNDLNDIKISGDGTFHIRNNTIGDHFGISTIDESNLLQDPRFNDGVLNYTLSQPSPAIDAGTKPPSILPVPIPFYYDWTPGQLDLAGNLREQGAWPDMGAFETAELPDRIFYHAFEAP